MGVCPLAFLIQCINQMKSIDLIVFMVRVGFIVSIFFGMSACSSNASNTQIQLTAQSCNDTNSVMDSLLICDEFSSKFENKKFLCLISYSSECSIAKNYIATIKKLVNRFGTDVQFCLIDPGLGSKRITGLESLFFNDNWGFICHKFGITVYPQAVVFDCLNRCNIYSGKIDDRAVSLGVIKREAIENYLEYALSDVIIGKSKTIPSNEAIGCFIGPFERNNIKSN